MPQMSKRLKGRSVLTLWQEGAVPSISHAGACCGSTLFCQCAVVLVHRAARGGRVLGLNSIGSSR
jgi:hypothetical protein